jgi:WD40 repeat protein
MGQYLLEVASMNLNKLLAAAIAIVVTTLASPYAHADLLVSGFNNNEVLRYNQTTGAFEGVFASGGSLTNPVGLTYGPDGNLYVASSGSNQVLEYNGTSGAFIRTFASIGAPEDLVFGPNGNLYVSSYSSQAVVEFNGTTGANMGIFASGHGLTTPAGLAFGPDGNLYVSNYQQFSTGNVLSFNGATGAFISTFIPTGDGGLSDPSALVFAPNGNLYVTDYFDGVVRGYNSQTGASLGYTTSGGPAPTRAFDVGIGPDGNVYMSTGSPQSGAGVNSAIFEYSSQTGDFIDSFVPAGSGGLNGASFFTFTPQAVPEPSSLILFGTGILGLVSYLRRGRKPAVD